MSSATASGQRKTLKALAQTPYEVFEDEHAEVIVAKVVWKDARTETKEAIKANNEKALSEDVSMDDSEFFQCGYCGDYHEDWIQCENKACKIQWYGLDCVGLDEAPAGRWICAMCRPRPVFPNLAGAPRGMSQDDVQQKPKGVAIKKTKIHKPKPGWKGWIEVPDEVKAKMQREIDAQWEVKELVKRTRTSKEIYEGEQKRRLRSQNVRENRRFQPTEDRESQQTNIPTPWEEDIQSMNDDPLAQEPAAALNNHGKLPLSEPMVYPEDDGIIDEEADGLDDGISAQYDRESTFEGFSDPEKANNIGSGLEQRGVFDEDGEAEHLLPSDQSANEFSDADRDLDLEMTDDIEYGLDGLSVMDEDEAERIQSGDQLDEEVSDVDEDHGVERRALLMEDLSQADVGGGSPIETLGVGAMDYTYLDLSRYGPHLVRRS